MADDLSEINRNEHRHTKPGSRRLIACALILAAATVVWLVATASASEHESVRLFGLWRTRHVLVGCLGAWLTLISASALSRKALFRVLFGTMLAISTWLLLEAVGLVGLVDYRTALHPETGPNVLGKNASPNIDVAGATYQDTATWLGLETDPIRFRYKTDRRGYRNVIDRLAADIYMLGDSILVAGLLPFEETVTALLEENVGHPTMNIALIGISPQEERDIFRDAQLPLTGCLVLHFIFEGNDLLDSAGYRKRSAGRAEKRPSLVSQTLAYNVVIELQRWTDPRWKQRLLRQHTGFVADELYTFRWTADSFVGLDAEVPHVLEAIGDVRRAVSNGGGSYVVVMVPTKLRVLGPLCTWPTGSKLADFEAHLGHLPDQVQQRCEQEGIDILDLTQPLRESAANGRIPWFPGDTHWNAIGHEIAADSLIAWSPVRQWVTQRAEAGGR